MAFPEDTPTARRVRIRRSRSGGFAGGGVANSTRLESYRGSETDAEHDEVDDILDPESIHQRITSAPVPSARDNSIDGAADPRTRLNQVALAGSQNYSKEYRLTLLHRMLMRRVPLDQIAQQLKVSVSTIEKDRVELKKRLRENARVLDINEIIGDQSELYNEISGMALRVASDDKTPQAMRLAAMRTTLAANADRTRFLASAGVFDALRFRRNSDGEDQSDIARLMERTNEMLASFAAEPMEETVPRKPRTKAAGFTPFSIDDADASGSANEIDEL